MRFGRRFALVVCAVFAAAGLCHADMITVTINPVTEIGVAGNVLTFSGTLSNSSGSILYLNSAGINLAGGFGPGNEDTSPFFINAPLFLSSGDSTSQIDLFTISIPTLFLVGTYPGTFTVLGGVDSAAQDVLGSAGFDVQVGATSAVPESSSGFLVAVPLLILLLGHGLQFRRPRLPASSQK